MRSILMMAFASVDGLAHAETQTLTAEIWADNWFAMYADGTLVVEDSVK